MGQTQTMDKKPQSPEEIKKQNRKKMWGRIYVFLILAVIILLASIGYCEGWDDLGDEGMSQATTFSQGTAGASIATIGVLGAFGRMALGGAGAGKQAAVIGAAGIGIGAAPWLGQLMTGIGKTIGA